VSAPPTGAPRAPWWRRPFPWIVIAFTVVPFVLSYLPGIPVHGYGHVWYVLPLWLFWRHPRERGRIALYALGWALQVLAYPEPDLGFLGWVLLVPYLVARERDDGAVWWRSAMLYGFFRGHIGFYWLGQVHFAAWLSVSFGAAIAFAFVFEATLRYARALPFALRAAVGWTLFEWVHSWLGGGFPWLYLSHSQYRFGALIQIADLVGSWGVSFLMAYVQAAAFVAVRAVRGRRPFPREAVVAVLLLAATLAYGWTRPADGPVAGRPRVLLVQSSFPHSVKENIDVTGREVYETLIDLTARGLEADPGVALVVWPESMHPQVLLESEPGGFAAVARDFARRFGKPVIYGLNSFEDEESFRRWRGYNAAILADAQGHLGKLYRKQRLVPMGEEFLLRRFVSKPVADEVFDWLVDTLGYPQSCDLEAGKGQVTLDAGPGLRCAMLICFEGMYDYLARRAVMHDDPDLILHLVNNGWFGHTWEARQMLAHLVFRAVETRTPLVSCANGGVSCVIAPSGRFVAVLDRVMESGTLSAHVPRRRPPPLYLTAGPRPLVGAVAAAILLSLLERWLRRRRAAG